jgi:hypothetical protein
MNKVFFTCIVLFTFLSCHSLVEDEFPDTKRIPVINGYLEQGKTFKVHVTFSTKVSDSIPPPVENAQVIIESTTKTPDTLKHTENGYYVSSRIVQIGETYTCKVHIAGYPTLLAQTTVPEQTEVDSVYFTDLAQRGEEGEKISSLEFFIANNLLKKQYWHVLLISEGLKTYYDNEKDDLVQNYSIENETIYMLAGQDTTLLNEANPLTLFSNKLINKNSYKVKFYVNESYTRFYSDQTYYIELRSVDEAYYKYLKQYYIYESASFTEIGKSPQKYPLYSNVTNGLGIFYSYSSMKKQLIINTANP